MAENRKGRTAHGAGTGPHPEHGEASLVKGESSSAYEEAAELAREFAADPETPSNERRNESSEELVECARELLWSVQAAVEAARQAMTQIGCAVTEAWEAMREPPQRPGHGQTGPKSPPVNPRYPRAVQPAAEPAFLETAIVGPETTRAIQEAACALRDMAIAIREAVVDWHRAATVGQKTQAKPQSANAFGRATLGYQSGPAWQAAHTAQEFADAASDAAQAAQMAADKAAIAATGRQQSFPTMTAPAAD
jgi:hypothetical protein